MKGEVRKMRKILQKISQFITVKKMLVISSIIYIGSMLPNWLLAFIARPAGDDYGYSADSHQAWLQTHSLIEVIKAGLATTKNMCNAWNGDWFSVFIFTLMPEVFVYRSFWIVPIFWSLATIGATWYLLYQILTKCLKIRWQETAVITFLTLFISYQWIPSSGIGLYWYVGVIHYIMPHVIALFLLGFLVRFLQTGKKKYIVLSAFGMIAIGGSSYYATFLVMLTYLPVFLCGIRTNKKLVWLSVPSVTCLVALYFQVTAPGNKARVGEGIGFTIEKAINTIIDSLLQGGRTIGKYLCETPYIFLLLFLLAVIMWCALSRVQFEFTFRFPLLFVGYMYGVYASMFAPEIYAATEVSGGPPTMEYLTFLLTAVASIVYVEGWCIGKLRVRGVLRTEEWYRTYLLIPYVVFMCLVMLALKGEIKETLFYESVEYIASGAAADYKEQMESQEAILLDDSIKEAYLCPTNDQQGPLMHMPVIDKPDAFTNWVVKRFYGKDYVIAVGE